MNKIVFLAVSTLALSGCFGVSAVERLSFEDHRQIVNINNYGGTVYVQIQNPDGYDKYRKYLEPRTVFIEKDEHDMASEHAAHKPGFYEGVRAKPYQDTQDVIVGATPYSYK